MSPLLTALLLTATSAEPSNLKLLRVLPTEAADAAFTPDGKHVLVASTSGVVSLRDVATGRVEWRAQGHDEHMHAVAVSPDGKLALSGGGDGKVDAWNIATGKPVFSVSTVKAAAVSGLAWSADGRVAMATTMDHAMELWDGTGESLGMSAGTGMRGVSVSKDGRRGLVWNYGNAEPRLTVLDIKAQPKFTIPDGKDIDIGVDDEISTAALSPDGKRALAGAGHRLVLWDVEAKKRAVELSDDDDAVGAVAISPNGKLGLSGAVPAEGPNPNADPICKSCALKLWDITSGKQLTVVDRTPYGHLAAHFSPDGTMALTLAATSFADGSGGVVKVWKLDTAPEAARVVSGKLVRTFTGHTGPVWAVTAAADGTRAASASEDHSVKLWDLASGRVLDTLATGSAPALSVAFDARAGAVMAGTGAGTVYIWDGVPNIFPKLGSAVRSVVFTDDGLMLAGLEKGSIGELTGTLGEFKLSRAHDGAVTSLSMRGTHLLSASADKGLTEWEVFPKALQQHSTRKLPSPARAALWSPDGAVMFVALEDGTVRSFDPARKALQTLKGHTDAVVCLAMSPDGKLLASGSRDKSARVWSTATGELLATLNGHEKTVTSVAFTLDGKQLITGSADGTLKLWDL
jgi:WD40 repeat protein